MVGHAAWFGAEPQRTGLGAERKKFSSPRAINWRFWLRMIVAITTLPQLRVAGNLTKMAQKMYGIRY